MATEQLENDAKKRKRKRRNFVAELAALQARVDLALVLLNRGDKSELVKVAVELLQGVDLQEVDLRR